MTQVFDLNQIAIDFRPQNNGKRPVIFVHGNSQNSSCGQDLLTYFYELGHSVLAYDLPGHGDSPLPTEEFSFEDLVSLNYDITRSNELYNAILAGHSLGGMIHAGTIIRHQMNNTSLILCGSYDGNPITAAKRQMQDVEAAQIDEELAQYIEEGYKLFKRQFKYDYFSGRHLDDEIISIMNRRYANPVASDKNLNTMGDFNARQALIDLGIPLLVLHGEDEAVIPKALVKVMLAEHKNARACWYPEAGHYAFYQYPELTRNFIEKNYHFINPT